MAGLLVCATALGGLSGCVSTQHKNARAKLVADRILNGRRPLRVADRSRDVRVLDVALVRGRRRGALVVELRNGGRRALTDVPIAVGVRAAGGRRVQLNGGRGLDWFQTHVPAIGAGQTTSWVFVPRRRALPAGRPWALAGPAHAVGALPPIAVTSAGRDGDAIRVALANRSEVPQYGLQVYAVVRAHGRVLAAGTASVRHLGSRASASARLTLVGAPGDHTARIHAPATIFD